MSKWTQSALVLLLSELLDKEEFGEGLERSAYDENEANSAEELGLLVGIILKRIGKHVWYTWNLLML